MRFRVGKRRRLWSLLAGSVGLLGIAATPSQAQIFHRGGSSCPPPPCPAPEYRVPTATERPEPTAPPPQRPTVEFPTLEPERGLALGGETAAFAPNIIGDLLDGSRSVLFFYNRVTGPIVVGGSGSTSISNPKVADNNSPIPQDRVSFRYNHFDRALAVTGLGGAPILTPQGFAIQPTTTRSFDVDEYTFSLEKTFFDQRISAELRVPFKTGLASKLDLSAGSVTAVGPQTDQFGNPILQVNPTPENTLGKYDTEFDNLSVILKGLAYRGPRLGISGGLGIGIPTAENTRVRVTDFTGQLAGPNVLQASIQRQREIEVGNDTVSLSPFLAVVATPTQRSFAQGFLQFDFPAGSNNVTYRSLTNAAGFVANVPVPGVKNPPFTETASIDEQVLMHVDVGAGYWLVRRPCARWLTGLAPTLELHYTTTLDNADLVRFSSDPIARSFDAAGNPLPNGVQIPEPGPLVGNRRNRVDILDLTVGTTFEIANRATLATAFAFPLLGGDNRVFDWEFQVQFNYYFGGPRRRSAPPL